MDPADHAQSKQPVLIAFYQQCWNEMTWRRNAGYRTIILGMAYCGALLTAVAFHPNMPGAIKLCLAAIVAIATLFGSGYLASNYGKYMSAAARVVKIEESLGAFDADFLGKLGALLPPSRRDWPNTPLVKDPVSFLSIIAFLVGGLLTAAAIALV
jgi:hypothetical protein